LKDKRRSLKHVYSLVKHSRRASHTRLEKSEKLSCPHQCEASLQLIVENSGEQLWSCSGCNSMIKVAKRGDNR